MGGAERQAGEDQAFAARLPAQATFVAREPLQHRPRTGRRELGDGGQPSHEAQPRLLVLHGERAEQLVAQRDGLLHAVAVHERPHELLRGGETRRGVGRALDRLAQTVDGRRLEHDELRGAQREQDGVALLRGRRLGECPLEVGAGRIGGPAVEHLLGRGEQPLDDPPIAARLGREQVRRQRHVAGAGIGEQPRGAPVPRGALRGRDLLEDRRAHDRVDELQRAPVAEDRRRRQRVGGLRRDAGGELGQGGGLAQVRAPAEHGDGKGELAGGRAEPAQAGEGRPGDRLGRDLRHPHGAGFVGHDAVGRERAQQFAQEKRIAARRHMTGVREGL